MPIRTLDLSSALLVIDFQEGTRRYTGSLGPEAYGAAARLAAAFRNLARPVVLVRMQGGRGGRSDVAPEGSAYSFSPEAQAFVPELGQQASDIVITRSSWGAFTGTDLQQRIVDLGITQVVICGTAASIGVESTVRQAYELGFNVTIASDATTDFNVDAMKNSIERIFPILAEVGLSKDIIRALESQSG